MSNNIIREYLVSLGFGLNEPELRQFENALSKLDSVVGEASDSMAGNFGKFLFGANAAVVGIAGGLVGLVEHFGNTDQSFRLFAERSYLSMGVARSFKTSLDALGVSLADIYRDKPLYDRFMQLMHDQKTMSAGLPSDFESTMGKVQELSFQFTRLRVEATYGLMGLADTIFKSFGGEDFLTRFQRFNDWVVQNLPHLVETVSTQIKPIIGDIMDIGRETWDVFKNLATIFVQLTGELSGDQALAHGQANFENIAKATKLWLDQLLQVVRELDYVVKIITDNPALVKILGGAALGAWVGSAGGPAGMLWGAGIGATAGAVWSIAHADNEVIHSDQEKQQSEDQERRLHAQAQKIIASSNLPTQKKIIAAAREAGVPESIALSVAYQESRFNNAAVSPKGAQGVFQLMPDTAKALGVDPNNEDENIKGGVRYLRQLADQFGDWNTAVRAYNEGPSNARKGLLPGETAAYVPEVMRRAQDLEDARQRYDTGSRQGLQPMSYHVEGGDTNIHVDVGGVSVPQPGASVDDVHATVSRAVAEGVRDGIGKQNAKNLFELSGVYS